MFHLAAIGPTLACAAAGAALISDTYFDAARALGLIEAERATHLYPAYPPITEALLDDPRFPSTDVKTARAMLNVGPPETLRKMQAAIPGAVQVSLYGSTEGGGAITFGSLDDDLDTRVATCGLPLPGIEVRIVDPDTGEDVPVGEPGEIRVRGFGLFGGYANDVAKTDAAFDADGWYLTGDRGALDGDGRLRFLGRLKDMLKVGGENVAPAEIEAVLSTHPAVKLVQVVGVPDARLEEVPAAFVETKSGASVTEEELAEYCRERIARFKLPRYVRFVTDWPMSATKIQKGPLREQLLAELSRAAGAVAD
jgi:acyl-CoA synthetase (AMP-forming)/AMP-acid ligase II